MNEAQALVRLQEIDLSLIRYDGEIRKLPQLKKLAAIKQAQKKLAQDMTKIVGQRKDAELELKDNEDMTERLKQHEEEVKAEANEDGHSPRELQDFENQLTMLAKRREKYEFTHEGLKQNLQKMLDAEAHAGELKIRLDEETENQTRAYQDVTAGIRESVKELTEERKRVLSHISPEMQKKYSETSTRFGGLAVETLHGNKPSICRVALQPSDFGDIARKGQICECPYCHRILVTGTEEE
ncbi:MAG: C4-type zinc ribbon domain-containing protein [Olsenella sp.]